MKLFPFKHTCQLLALLGLVAVASGCDSDSGVEPDPPPTTYTLSVESISPESDVAVGVSPADVNGAGNGETSFQREYEEGTEVTLAAPQEASNGNVFLRWEMDNSEAHEDMEITVSMTRDRTATARFSTSTTFTVASSNPSEGILVRMDPPDDEGTSEGETPLELHYLRGQRVQLFPEALSPEGDYFRAWDYDGPKPEGIQEITLTVEEAATATSHYAAAEAAIDTTYEVGGRPSGLPENEMTRTLELPEITEAVIEEERLSVFYDGEKGWTALPHTAIVDRNGSGEPDTPVSFFHEAEPGVLTLHYVADTDEYMHPEWLPERVVIVIFEE